MKHLINIKYEELERGPVKPSPRSYYNNPVGVWKVTTEGDCEGKSVKDLGIWSGHVCEIAFHLSSQAYYALNFSVCPNVQIKPNEVSPCVRSKMSYVNISMNIESETWNLNPEDRAKWFKNFLNLDEDSNIKVKVSNLYACALLEIK